MFQLYFIDANWCEMEESTFAEAQPPIFLDPLVDKGRLHVQLPTTLCVTFCVYLLNISRAQRMRRGHEHTQGVRYQSDAEF